MDRFFVYPVIPFFVYPVIPNGAKNLLPSVHAGRSAIPAPIRRALDAPNEIHPSLPSRRMTFVR